MQLINENDLQNVCGGVNVNKEIVRTAATVAAACIAMSTSGLIALLICCGNEKSKVKKEENQPDCKIVHITKIIHYPAHSIYCKKY